MKRLFVMVLASLFAMGISAKSPAQQLIKRLKKLQKLGVMIGHQDDPVYGTTWKWEHGRSDVKDVCGDYPAVMGFDVSGCELDSANNIDGVPFVRMREEIIAQYNRGGVITLSWHPTNAVTGGNAWDVKDRKNVVGELLAGGSKHDVLNTWLKKISSFINSLRTSNGTQIPVIFRPWHEMQGSWFWWGADFCTPQQYKDLYAYTHNKMNDFCKGNLVWCYSPGMIGGETADTYLKFYPGDDCVDMLGMDAYQWGDKNDFIGQLSVEMKVMTKVGKAHKKMIALTETGYQNTPDSIWFTTALLRVVRPYKLSYLLLWRNAWNNPKENFGPASEKACAKDFVNLYNDKQTLFLNDIKSK